MNWINHHSTLELVVTLFQLMFMNVSPIVYKSTPYCGKAVMTQMVVVIVKFYILGMNSIRILPFILNKIYVE